ncbi:MAG: hypothetical protein N2444_05985 [Methylocystis sp.]|nr:hypothetical protein [Methylocystis sp.]
MDRFPLDFKPVRRTGPAAAARGRALEALNDSEWLRDRFFSWRGASGRRYVCSVFQVGESAFVAELARGVIIGVARESAPRPVCVLPAGVGFASDRAGLWRYARELGVTEWHVLFCAEENTLRDIAASLLN